MVNFNVEDSDQIYICPYCLNTFKAKSLHWSDKYIGYEDDKVRIRGCNKPELHVMCNKCEDYMFLCDSFIAPQIIHLNEVGLTTSFCCEGHIYTDADGNFVAQDAPYVVIDLESNKYAKSIYNNIINNHLNRIRFKNLFTVDLECRDVIKCSAFSDKLSVKHKCSRITIRIKYSNIFNEDGSPRKNFKEIFEKEKYLFKIFLHNLYSMKKINL